MLAILKVRSKLLLLLFYNYVTIYTTTKFAETSICTCRPSKRIKQLKITYLILLLDTRWRTLEFCFIYVTFLGFYYSLIFINKKSYLEFTYIGTLTVMIQLNIWRIYKYKQRRFLASPVAILWWLRCPWQLQTNPFFQNERVGEPKKSVGVVVIMF